MFPGIPGTQPSQQGKIMYFSWLFLCYLDLMSPVNSLDIAFLFRSSILVRSDFVKLRGKLQVRLSFYFSFYTAMRPELYEVRILFVKLQWRLYRINSEMVK